MKTMMNVFKQLAIVSKKQAYHKYNRRCAYCGCIMSFNETTKDHIVPKSKGGKNCFLNYLPCCKLCNSFKGSKNIEEFRSAIATTKNEEIKQKYKNWHYKFYFEVLNRKGETNEKNKNS